MSRTYVRTGPNDCATCGTSTVHELTVREIDRHTIESVGVCSVCGTRTSRRDRLEALRGAASAFDRVVSRLPSGGTRS